MIDPKTGKEHREFFCIGDEGFVSVSDGITARTLAGALDEKARRGNLNRMVKWLPGAEINEVKIHDFYEEVLVLQGDLWVWSAQPGIGWEQFPAYSFACRPPGIPHGPFRAGKSGCLLFETQFYL